MTDFEKAEPTNELRWVTRTNVGEERAQYVVWRVLQQKWRITRASCGAVTYSEEWRTVEVVEDGNE